MIPFWDHPAHTVNLFCLFFKAGTVACLFYEPVKVSSVVGTATVQSYNMNTGL